MKTSMRRVGMCRSETLPGRKKEGERKEVEATITRGLGVVQQRVEAKKEVMGADRRRRPRNDAGDPRIDNSQKKWRALVKTFRRFHEKCSPIS